MRSAGSFVQTNGVGWSCHVSMCRPMWVTSAFTVSNDPRRTDLRVSRLNHTSTRFSHEAPVGVK